ncbi:MAG: hypothetical protein ACI9S8_002356 [Chlamydiales bacterium]|jgi:hypothetical protein
MNFNALLPIEIRDLSPIFVVAPTPRCGSTLIQRLLNSTNKVVIFGEDALISEALPDVLDATHHRMECQEQEISLNRKKFKEETRDFWSNALLPESTELFSANVAWFSEVMKVYTRSAENLGCSIWGSKFPLRSFHDLDAYKRFLPRCRIIYIYRDLFDIARSCKARKWLETRKDVFNLAQRWKLNLSPFLGSESKQTLILRYEDLISKPEEYIKKIENFVNVSGIDRSIMNKKINTWKGDKEEGRSETGYIPPETLTDNEEKLLQRIAREVLERTSQ